jgi:5-hydroxyisourate hydrolase-like protein (transthyretin family)
VKTSLLAGCLLLWMTPACPCSVQVNASPKKSSQNVVLTVLFEGKPREGAKVEVYRCRKQIDESPQLSLISDADGAVKLSALAPGEYCIIASAGLDLRSDLDIRVSPRSQETTSFSMELAPSQSPTFDQQIAAVEQKPIAARLPAFSGVVRDPLGTAISGVSIEIQKKGTQGKKRVTEVKSGKDGTFSSSLADGAYIAIFSFPGFSTQLVSFEITRIGGRGDLRVKLDIGQMTE